MSYLPALLAHLAPFWATPRSVPTRLVPHGTAPTITTPTSILPIVPTYKASSGIEDKKVATSKLGVATFFAP